MSMMDRINLPYLFRFATPRTCDDREMPGRYCSEQQMWVIDTDQGAQPIVLVAPETLAATQTKTMTQVEADDDDQGRGAMMETSTYTRVRQEADDEDASLELPEIQTKTDTQQETDDQVNTVI